MGRIDIEARNYLRDNRHFADAFNYYLYDGRPVIDPAALRALDTAEIAVPASGGGRRPTQGFRDVLKAWQIMEDERGVYAILGAEAQAHVHYAMPVKCGLYDFMRYSDQVEEARRAGAGRAGVSGDEFLSGFRRDGRLKPVVTLVIYFGEAEWDGPMGLHDMFQADDPALMRFVPDYRINLIAPARMSEPDFRKFRTDLGRVLEFIKYSREKDKLVTAVNRDAGYRAMDADSYELIRLVTHSNLRAEEKEGKIDMCLAIEEIRRESMQQGESNAIVRSIYNIIEKTGLSATQAMDLLGIPVEDRERYAALMKEWRV